jgi:CheY-like chemotaxis protein
MPGGGKLTIQTANVRLDASYAEAHSNVEPGDYVMLVVTDTGTGMDAETQRRMFEPFFTTKDVGKGTGLGLATVYGIVTQSRGHVSVDSEVGRGTSFHVFFPRVDEVHSPPPPRAESPRPSRATGTILVVEDDEAVRRVTVRILRARGYEVLEARCAADAREVFAEHGARIDLLLTDVVMPETSGPKLVEALSGSWPSLRVLFMSGYPGSSGAHEDQLAVGAPYIEKPFTASSLVEKVHDVLAGAVRR